MRVHVGGACYPRVVSDERPGPSDDFKKCGAKLSRGRGTCAQAAGFGTAHPGYGKCKFHFGSTPAVTKAAEKERAAEAVETYGLPIEVTPEQALIDELHRTAGHVSWLAYMVAKVEEAELVGPVGSEGMDKSDVMHHPKAEANIWLRLYQGERKHFADVAATCIKVGIAQRQIELAEQQGELIARLVTGILDDLGIDPRSSEARDAIRRNFTLVQGGKAEAA